MMFFTNIAYTWGGLEEGGHGICVSAWGVNREQALQRVHDRGDEFPDAHSRIFDPQLYLSDLNLETSEKAIRRLATYPWFNPGVEEREEGQSLRDWEDRVIEGLNGNWPLAAPTDAGLIRQAIEQCFAFQREFGVGRLVIPSPLTSEQDSDFSSELVWLDQGLAAVPDDNDAPVLATIALSDQCLVHRDPPENDLLEAIVDQVAARPVDGAYIVIRQDVNEPSQFIADRRTVWSILSVSYDLAIRMGKRVFVNYVDVAGLLCMAVGAEGFATGPSNRSSRLIAGDFVERGGGGPFPRFYSHQLLLNLLPERDLEQKIVPARLLRLIEPDETEHSRSLIDSLRTRTPVHDVGDWQERVNNTTASDKHYMERVKIATEGLSEEEDKLDAALTWLQDAERDTSYLADRFEDDPLSPDYRHVTVWRGAFESFLGQKHL